MPSKRVTEINVGVNDKVSKGCNTIDSPAF